MAISLDKLDRAATRTAPSNLAKSLQEARASMKKTAFLSHSHLDAKRAKGLQTLLAEEGWDVFIDWEHTSLDDRPTKETVQLIQTAINRADWLFYLATPNAGRSRWCPWEIGYADGKKSASAIVVIATSDSQGTYGSEYLNLYSQISTTSGEERLGFFKPASSSSGRYLREVATVPTPY
jgi:TIR domain